MYTKPKLITFLTKDLQEIIGPVQSASVHLFFQQVEQTSQLDIQQKYAIVQVAEINYPEIYNNNNKVRT